MVMDDISPGYPETARQIIALLDGNITEHQRDVAEILGSWEGGHGLRDIGPTIYYHLVNRIQQNTFQDELGAENFRVYSTTLVARRTFPLMLQNDGSIWWDDSNTEQVETRAEIINRSFRESVQQLTNELGSDPQLWHWEKVHILEHQHAIGRQKPFNFLFNVGPFPVTGGDEVINKMDFNKFSMPYQVRSGASMRILIDLADMENSLSVIPTGQSGHVLSPHYQDQAPLYNAGKFRPQHMNWQKIEALAEGVLILMPEGVD
jgi:penicillin amidase